jgi:hypothetical protein
MIGMFSKKTKPLSESEAIDALNSAIKEAIKTARDDGLHPARIANGLNGHAAEVMTPIYAAQERRQCS